MQKREKILAGAFAGVVALWLGVPFLENKLVEPLRELETREEGLQEQVDKKSIARLKLAQADNDLKNWRNISLPPDQQDAQRLYQEWLIDLAQMSGLTITKVNIDRRIPQGDTYFTIPITLEASATLKELTLFLERFESVDLLHRVARCDVTSPASEGNPKLGIIFTAEGLSMLNAKERSRLFPEAFGQGELSRSADQVAVLPVEEFPKDTPFMVRVSDEFIKVKDIANDTWSLERGVNGTSNQEHGENPLLELFPTKPATIDETLVKNLVSQSFFTKPAPAIEYKPKFESTSPPIAIQGKPWNWKLQVNGWNPANGKPLYAFLDAPEGMLIDETSGAITWDVPEDEPTGELTVDAVAWGESNPDAGLTTSLTMKIREQNRPPKIEPLENVRFFLGRESRLTVKATDPDEDDRLSYSMEGAPEGMTLNSSTGEIRWTPPLELEPQEMSVTVTVKDNDEMAEQSQLIIPFAVAEDSAKYAYLVACLDIQPQGKEAWIFDRVTNQKTVLHIGETAQIADLEIEVEEIGKDHLIVKRFEDRYKLEFEQPLSQMMMLPKAPPMEPVVEEQAKTALPPSPQLPEVAPSK